MVKMFTYVQHLVQEATEEASRPVLLYGAAVAGRVDLHGHGLPWGLGPPLHPRQVTTVQDTSYLN
jgi:hypothetical protein